MMPNVDPRQMKKMMQQLGIKQEEIPAKRVVFELESGKMIIENPVITAIDMQGKKTYTVMGETVKEASIPEEDVKMVAEQAGISEEKARKALEENDGDIAKTISQFKK